MKKLGLLIPMIAFFFCSIAVRAATVTVDGKLPAWGGNYQTLKAAIDAYPQWKSGPDNTIEVSGSMVNPVTQVIQVGAVAAGEVLSIVNKPASRPVVEIDTAYEDRSAINLTGGSLVVKGLVFIGSSTPGRWPRFVIALYRGVETGTSLRVEDCLFTANNGHDVPVTDLTTAPMMNGTFAYGAISVGDDPLDAGDFNVAVKDCVVAYCQALNGGGVANMQEPPAGKKFTCTIEHSLFIRNGVAPGGPAHPSNAVGTNYLNGASTVAVKNSAFIDNGRAGVGFSGNGTITVEDCVFKGGSYGVSTNNFPGTLSLARCTFWGNAAGNDGTGVALESMTTAATYHIEDCIFAGLDKAFLGDGDIPKFTIGHCAIGPGIAVTMPTAIQAIVAANVIHDNPMFLTTATPTPFAVGHWDSVENSMFDVNNPVYGNKASDGGPLSGGAEYALATPTPTPSANASIEWQRLD